MKRNCRLLLTLATLLICCMGFTSCSDDDILGGGSSIVGTWKSGNETMKLGSDGSYYSSLDGGDQYRKGTYTYSSSSKTLVVSVVAIPNHNNAYTDTYYVQTLSSTTLTLVDMGDGSSNIWTRQ